MNATIAQTSLFTSPALATTVPGEVSARAAFQLALYARAALVDARRDRRTTVHPDLLSLGVEQALLGVDAPRLLLLVDTEEDATPLVERVRAATSREVAVVSGGFAAWLEARLPVVGPAA